VPIGIWVFFSAIIAGFGSCSGSIGSMPKGLDLYMADYEIWRCVWCKKKCQSL